MGGSTTICNGQALCPSCNLSKSNNTMSNRFRDDIFGPAPYPKPLKWQEKAIREFERTDDKFLADATPGAGKTAFTAYLFRHHYGDLWERIIVITNGITRRGEFSSRQEKAGGWISDLAKFGIETMQDWLGYTERPTLKDYNGCVLTYAKLPGNESALKALSFKKPTLVVFDEIHHLGDNLAWGEAAREAFSHRKCYTVGLTGTPFRSDDARIPFVDYERQEDGTLKSVGHVGYTYGDALRDEVLRYINFETYEGEMEWNDSTGEKHVARFEDDIPEHLMGGRLVTAVTDKDWLLPVIKEADEKLSETRKRTPEAGGLIVAKDQMHAERIAAWMREDDHFKEEPDLVVSDEHLATSDIESFKHCGRRWVIAVQMISEGVNIKRLRVGVYASNVTAPLTIHQVVGRVLRGPDGYAWFHFPKDPRIVEELEKIEEMRDHVIKEKEGGGESDGDSGDSQFLSISAERGEGSVMGPLFDEMEMMDEEQLRALPNEVLAAFIRRRGASTTQQQSASHGDGSPSMYAQEQKLRREISKKPGYVYAAAKAQNRALYMRGGTDKGKAIAKTHTDANHQCGITSTDEATVEQLEAKRDLLKKWATGQ
jgi:superfamily II DNA or RNA helicase